MYERLPTCRGTCKRAVIVRKGAPHASRPPCRAVIFARGPKRVCYFFIRLCG